ncbi:sigma-E factor negative regulatory protein [Lysobacter yananisis]|uniref:Sigma-E factor negative regulatory protein n=1 Tax=Lysobacter yananisis TaxID=1003114 RepID=A0ABY9P971_9GAMM|nr:MULTISPECIES: sigma-E factor negative regulatory protein [Lysobacter]UZW59155.1 sigma-E factor negative regulatory protein [Lysobacter enzymogenes]WMT02908.1 sigma-E factor negative regulatory protein [Lysobacter yananisis]
MTSTIHSGDDNETLSALFDGELDGDAARFAFKRLSHDGQWREACGRWQLCGDVLRRRAHGAAEPAPGFAATGFAERVAAAIAADAALQASQAAAAPPAQTEIKPRKAAGSRRGWIGGAALAASVAVAALFVARPFSDEAAGGVADPAQVAAQAAPGAAPAQPAAPAVPQPAPAQAPQALAAQTPATAETGLTSADASGIAAGAAVAVAELPRRLNERRSRGQSQRAAVRASERQTQEAPLQVAAAGAPMTAVADAGHANPFRPQSGETPAARPWPRAALPNYPSSSAYSASYGSSGLVSPSFYPFEPAQDASAARTRPPVQEPQPPQP